MNDLKTWPADLAAECPHCPHVFGNHIVAGSKGGAIECPDCSCVCRVCTV